VNHYKNEKASFWILEPFLFRYTNQFTCPSFQFHYSTFLILFFSADIVECIIGDEIVDETDAFVDNDQRIKVERGDTFEWARLRLLDTKIVDEMLSASEISAVTAHLKTNHAKSFKLLTDLQLRRLVSSTPVTTFSTATQVSKS
jgi:hypothetical protein